MQKLFDCNCTVPLKVRDSLRFKRQIGEACQVAGSLQFAIKGRCAAQSFQLRDILHCSGKLVTITRFAVTQRDCKQGKNGQRNGTKVAFQ